METYSSARLAFQPLQYVPLSGMLREHVVLQRHRPTLGLIYSVARRRSWLRASATAGNGTAPSGNNNNNDEGNGGEGKELENMDGADVNNDWTVEKDPGVLQPPDMPARTTEELRSDLLEALAMPSARPDGRGDRVKAIGQVIASLEAKDQVPRTRGFCELALDGKWKLLFSSFRSQLRGRVRVRSMTQKVDVEKGTLTNFARWSFQDRSGENEIFAMLTVENSFRLTETATGRMEIELKGHSVRIEPREDGKDQELPENMEEVIGDLQVAVPLEHFDPSGIVDVSYVDPQFRISRYSGKRLAGVRDVFERVFD